MSCNSESRRAINYSLQEPINNKYDLWLSENLRYNSEGALVYDSPGQPACDFILKIYKDGDWRPIAGLNTEHIVTNKINIVKDVNYTYTSTNDNELHVNNGFQLNHLPLFRNPQDSPHELFDAGTLGEAIYGFVNESEWLNILEGDAFTDAFESYFPTIVNNGSININGLIELANTEQIGGIKADTHTLTNLAFKPVECKFYPDISEYSNFYGRLSVNVRDIQNSLNELWEEDEELLIINGWKGITTEMLTGHQGIWVGLSGVIPGNAGKFCTIKSDSTDLSGATIDWVDLPEQQEYSILSSSDHNTGPYVISGCDEDSAAKFFLNGVGEWTEISGEGSGSTSYKSGVGIIIDNNNNSININTSDAIQGQVLSYDGDNDVEWVNLPSLVEGNNINTFVFDNKIYIRSYLCVISGNTFTLNRLTPVSDTYSNSIYPFIDFTDYQVESLEGVSSITIESEGTPYLQYPSYMHFTTSATKCTFTFPKTMEFIETKSVNSLSGEIYYYTNLSYIIELKPNTKYNVTFYKSCIKFETNSNSIFETPFNG